MPRTNVGVPWGQREIEGELRGRYGGYLTKTQIATELGMSIPTVYLWVEGLPTYKIGRYEKYSAKDVAKRIYESRTTERRSAV